MEQKRSAHGAPQPKARYFWLKLPRDFFERADTRVLMSGRDGRRDVCLYMQLLCEAMETDGCLVLREGVPHTVHTLARVLSCPEKTLTQLLERLTELGMLTDAGGYLALTDIGGMVGSEGKSAQRMRISRAMAKEAQAAACHNVQDAAHGVPNGDTEIEIEKEIEKEIEIEREKETKKAASESTPGHAEGVGEGRTRKNAEGDIARGCDRPPFEPPSEEAVRAYIASHGYRVDAVRFLSYYAARGWSIDGSPIASWQALLDSWAARPMGAEARERQGTFDPEEAFRRAVERSERQMREAYGGATP